MSVQEHPSVTTFREYLRIKTVQPDPDYATCMEFLKRQGKEVGAKVHVMESVPGKPIIVMTLEGRDPSLPSLLLNSHTDVVPVYPDQWKYDPFSSHKDEEGNIYGRGTQDMKSVGMQYLEALKQLTRDGKQFLRTVHLSFVPDEETDAVAGMKTLLKTDYFKQMNVGFALDEGYASTTDEFFVFYGERQTWHMWVKCLGESGHGSQFLNNTAGEKLRRIIDTFLSFRDDEERRLRENPTLGLGDVTTINLTIVQGGGQFNVVPAVVAAGFDIRIPPTVDVVEFEDKLRDWCKDAGDNVDIEFRDQFIGQNMTCVEDGQSVWWDAFAAACKKEKISVQKSMFPAGTDGNYLRALGIPVLGFSPMNNTPRLLHDHNEHLNEKVFLRGIQIYTSIIAALANCRD